MSLNTVVDCGSELGEYVGSGTIASVQNSFTSDFGELASIRNFLAEACGDFFESANCPEKLWQFEVAVVEAVVNVDKHSYDGRPDCQLHLEIELLVDRVMVSICHWGKAFHPKEIHEALFDGWHSSGFGLFMIERCTDGMEYFTDDAGMNKVRLTKRV